MSSDPSPSLDTFLNELLQEELCYATQATLYSLVTDSLS